MKKQIIGILLLLLSFAAQVNATAISTNIPSAGSWSANIASSMPGFGTGAILRPSSSGSLLEYTDKACSWNQQNNTILCLGGAHPNADPGIGVLDTKFVRYTDSTDTWINTMPNPVPTFDNAFVGTAAGDGIGHDYHHDTIKPSTGDYYHRQYGTGKVMVFKQATQAWSQCSVINQITGIAGPAGSLTYFLERDSLIYHDGNWGIFELSLASGNCTSAAWVQVAGGNVAAPPLPQVAVDISSGSPGAGYHNQAAYSSLCQCIFFVGQTTTKMFKMTAAGVFSSVAATPLIPGIPQSGAGAIFTTDPVSGHVLMWHTSNALSTMYDYNPTTNAWAAISRAAPAGLFATSDTGVANVVAVPIPAYGVIMFVYAGSASGGAVYLYKHAAGAADVTAPTAPTNLVATPISSTQINLTWTASTDNVGVTGYLVERCNLAACLNFVQVYSSGTNSQNDTSLAANTLYRYRVRATDLAGNLSAYSSPIVQETTLTGGGGGGSQTFAQRCAAAGVVRCFGFDTTADLGTQGGGAIGANFGMFRNGQVTCNTNPGVDDCPTIDTLSASGAGSMKFLIKSQSDAGASGQWFTNFSPDLLTQFGAGQSFFVQFRERMDSNFLNTFYYLDGGGWSTLTPAATVTPGANTGNSITFTASSGVLTGMAGTYIVAKTVPQTGRGLIRSVTDSTHAVVDIVSPFSGAMTSGNWQLVIPQNGIKQAIIGTGDNPAEPPTGSCTQGDIVWQNSGQRGFPQGYHNCGLYAPFEPFVTPPGDILFQNNMPSPYCKYGDSIAVVNPVRFFTTGNCFPYVANEWMTYQVGLTLGTFTAGASCINTSGFNCYKNSRIRMWAAREGGAQTLIIDYTRDLVAIPEGGGATSIKYGKVWLLPYQTNKDFNQVHLQGTVWFDELVVSTNFIADPSTATTDTTNPTVAITNPIPPTSSSTTSPIAVSGTAADNVSVTSVTWTCIQCVTKGGTATSSPGASISWTIPTLDLVSGTNTLNMVSHDAAGNVSTAATLTITYTPNTTYWVRPTGTMSGCTASGTAPTTDAGYKSTITAGVNCMAAGNRLIIRAGTYNERLDEEAGGITYPRATSWAGASIIEAMAGETVTVLPTAQNGNAVLRIASTATNYYLWFMGHNRNFIIDGTNVTTGQSVTKIQAPFVRLDSMEIRNGQTQNGGNGVIVVDPSTGVEILNNNIHNNGIVGDVNGQSYGIYAQSPNTIITGNDIHDNTGYGIQIYKSGGTPTNNTFANNRVYNNGCTTNIGGVLIQGTNHKVYNNLIYSNCGRPLEAYFSGDETGTVFYNNTLYGNINSDFALFLNNGVTARNNISSNNAGALVANGTGSVTADHNLCSSACGFGSSNVTDTAANTFVNAAAGNFHLGPNAFAKDQGVSTLGTPYNVDFDGLPRTSPWDIGAYEFVASGTSPVVTIVNPTSQPTLSVTQPLFSLGGTSNLP